ncbi:hypothetical protein B1R94_04435 [Mycolicibacterium litorale]|nr:hypothetical protein B1R94_04435 [Mycolicibacterium litorale]
MASRLRPTGPAAVMVHPDGAIGVVEGSPEAMGAIVGGPWWETMSSRLGVVFWFTTVGRRRNDVNRLATQLLLATSNWSAAEVPLLYGPVLVAARTPAGVPTALSMAHFEVLNARSMLSWRSRRTLRRRIEGERLAGPLPMTSID